MELFYWLQLKRSFGFCSGDLDNAIFICDLGLFGWNVRSVLDKAMLCNDNLGYRLGIFMFKYLDFQILGHGTVAKERFK